MIICRRTTYPTAFTHNPVGICRPFGCLLVTLTLETNYLQPNGGRFFMQDQKGEQNIDAKAPAQGYKTHLSSDVASLEIGNH